MAENWISCTEAAKRFGKPEEAIRQLIESGAIQGRKEGDKCEVEEEYFVASMKREKNRVEVTKIFDGLRGILLEYYKTIYAKEQAPHSSTRGTLYEKLIQDFLREYLPQRFYIGSGQVLSSHSVSDADGLLQPLSRQIDVVIFDNFNHPILLPKYELFPIEGTLAVIEVKSKLNKETLVGTKKEAGALANIKSAKRLISSETRILRSKPIKVDFERKTYDLRDMPPPLGIIFAFDSIEPKTIAQYWQDWNSSKEERCRTDMICLLKKQVLIVDSNRFERLFDPHQNTTLSPLRPNDKNKLVAIQTPAVLFCFFILLLRDLRKMSAFSQCLVETTPSSYFRNMPLQTLFSIDNSSSLPSDFTDWIKES